jgi:hypothetical protein
MPLFQTDFYFILINLIVKNVNNSVIYLLDWLVVEYSFEKILEKYHTLKNYGLKSPVAKHVFKYVVTIKYILHKVMKCEILKNVLKIIKKSMYSGKIFVFCN